MSFKTGDKLVCVRPGDPSIGLKKGKIYTCFNILTNSFGETAVEVLEAMPPEPYHGYLPFRFKKAIPSEIEEVSKTKTIEA